MYPIELTWWERVLLGSVLFMYYVGIGALLGFLVACTIVILPSGVARTRPQRLAYCLLGSLAGGTVQLTLVLTAPFA